MRGLSTLLPRQGFSGLFQNPFKKRSVSTLVAWLFRHRPTNVSVLQARAVAFAGRAPHIASISANQLVVQSNDWLLQELFQ